MPTNLSTTVDAYGKLIARIAELERQKEAMQADFKTIEAGVYEGQEYILTIRDSTRDVPDEAYKAEIADATKAFKASKSKQYLTAHMTKVPTRTHTTKARAPVESLDD